MAASQSECLVLQVVFIHIGLSIAVNQCNHLVQLEDALGDACEPHGAHLYLYLSFLFLHPLKLLHVAVKLADGPRVGIRQKRKAEKHVGRLYDGRYDERVVIFFVLRLEDRCHYTNNHRNSDDHNAGDQKSFFFDP